MMQTFHRIVRDSRSSLLIVAFSVIWLAVGCGKSPFLDEKVQTSAPPPKERPVLNPEERPATPKTMYACARILAAQGKDAECDQLLSRVLAASPKFQQAYILQAEVRVRQRRIGDAIATLQTAVRHLPRDHVLLNNLGMCLMMKNDCESALDCFTVAASIAPANSRYRANMAMSLGLLGREDESSSLYHMVVSKQDTAHNISVLNTARTRKFGRHITPHEPAPRTDAGPRRPAPIASEPQPEHVAEFPYSVYISNPRRHTFDDRSRESIAPGSTAYTDQSQP